jgi:hypothetical protein
MSSLAGFDLAVEIGPDGLLPQVLSGLSTLVPAIPFEQTITPHDDQGGGTAHFIIASAALTIQAEEVLRLTLHFERSSITGNGLIADTLDLAGRIDIDVAVSLSVPAHGDTTVRQLDVHLERAGVAAHIQPRPNLLLEAAIDNALMSQIRMAGAQSLPLPFRVDPGAAPSLSPLVVHDLVVKTLPSADATGSSLALLATMLPESIGDASAVTAPTRPAALDVTFRLSAAAFHALLLVPALEAALDVEHPELLPQDEGESESVPYPGLPDWSISHITDDLDHGVVRLSIEARHTEAEAGATTVVTIHAHITLDVVSGSIRPTWHTEAVTGGVEFGWGWWLVNLFAPTWIVMVTDAIATFLGAGGAAGAFSPSLPPTGLTLPIPGATLQSAWVGTDEVGIGGVLAHAWFPPDELHLRLSTNVMTLDRQAVESGTYSSVGCPVGDYPYTRYRQSQRAVVSAQPVLASLPVTYRWWVAGFDPPHDLDSDAGTITVESDCDFGPPPQMSEARGGLAVQYSLRDNGATLELENNPDDGSYPLRVSCTVTDHDGQSQTQYTNLTFAGDVVELGGTWQQDVADCARVFQGRLRRWQYQLGHTLPPGPGDPRTLGVPPQALIESVLGATAVGKGGASYLANLRMSVGSLSQFEAPILEGVRLESFKKASAE